MYLVHETTSQSLKKILNENCIKSLNLLEPKYINQGDGVYKNNKFVYFTTTDKLFDKKYIGHILIYINSDILYNRAFFVSTHHSKYPDKLYEKTINNIKHYKRKYNRYTKNYNEILKKLYKYSTNFGKAYNVFQQVAIKNKINIANYIIGIYISEYINDKETDKLIY
jgi:hypothetical protein